MMGGGIQAARLFAIMRPGFLPQSGKEVGRARIFADCSERVADDNFCQTEGLFARISRNSPGRPADNQYSL
jgi:hypothetical protein